MAKVKIKLTTSHVDMIKAGKPIEVRLPPNATELIIQPPTMPVQEFLNKLEDLFKR